MAIIKCPECGRQVSERAPICPNCGVEIAGKVVKCDNCGEFYFAEDGHCPSCHESSASVSAPQAAVSQQAQSTQQKSTPHGTPHTPVANYDSSAPKPKKKNAVMIVSFIIASLLCGTLFYFYSSKNTEKEQKEYEIAMKNEDPLVLQAYLNNYADVNPEHTKNIKDRLSFLQQGESEWNDVVAADNRATYADYMNNHPDSPHRAFAMNKIDSLDWVAATSVAADNSEQAIKKYIITHPDGTHASEANEILSKIDEEKKKTTVTPEEQEKVFSSIRKFFQSVNSKNEGGLRTVVSTISNIIGRPETGLDAAIAYMYDQYKGNVSNINWHLDHESLKITKQPDGDNTTYRASINAKKVTDSKDGSTAEKTYTVSVTIDSDGLITNISY